MSDVSALIGKLQANVAYRRFNAPATDNGPTWPVLERIAQAQADDKAPGDPQPAEAGADPSQTEPVRAEPVRAEPPQAERAPAAQPAPAPPRPTMARPAPAPIAEPEPAPQSLANSPLLRRIRGAPAPAAEAHTPTFSALGAAERAPIDAAPEAKLPPQPPLQPDVDEPLAPIEPERPRGSLLQRYAPAPEPEPDPGALSNIFARLERKTR